MLTVRRREHDAVDARVGQDLGEGVADAEPARLGVRGCLGWIARHGGRKPHDIAPVLDRVDQHLAPAPETGDGERDQRESSGRVG